MENETIQTPSYTSLTQIRARKETLKQQIDEEEDKVKVLWDKLFHPIETLYRHGTNWSGRCRRTYSRVETLS